MVADTVLFSYTKEIEEAGQGYFKMIHDENDVLTDEELVVARDFLKKSKYARLYIRNEYLRGFRLLNHV